MIRVNLNSRHRARLYIVTSCPWPLVSPLPITGIESGALLLKPFGQIESSTTDAVNSRSLIAELLLLHMFGQRQSERILAYLADQEFREPLVSLRDDIRIAWLTVLHCSQGLEHPWEYAFWRYLGKHPSKLIPEFVARASRHAAMEAEQSSEAASSSAPLPQDSTGTSRDIPPKTESPWLIGAKDCSPKDVRIGSSSEQQTGGPLSDLKGSNDSESSSLDRGKPKHGNQTRGTTANHIGVGAETETPAGLSAPADIALPPKKPVQSVNPRTSKRKPNGGAA